MSETYRQRVEQRFRFSLEHCDPERMRAIDALEFGRYLDRRIADGGSKHCAEADWRYYEWCTRTDEETA
jgi:hypothetical protein